jgi:hypothetical protein
VDFIKYFNIIFLMIVFELKKLKQFYSVSFLMLSMLMLSMLMLSQSQTDHINRMITIAKALFIHLKRFNFWLCQFDHINQILKHYQWSHKPIMITLSVITLRGFHYINFSSRSIIVAFNYCIRNKMIIHCLVFSNFLLFFNIW